MEIALRIGAAAIVACVAAAPAHAQRPADIEHRVKSAFLFNFAKFVTWPPAKADPAQAMLLCVAGPGDFAAALQATAADKTLHGRPIEVRQLREPAELPPCHVAYIGALDAALAGLYLDAGAGHGVLTVHEGAAATRHGVIRFFIRDNRVNFEINTAAAAREDLNVSSRLLSVAALVNL